MKFARIVFYTAGGIGLLAIIPMYLREGTYVYYASLAGLAAWQPAFLVIGRDPARYRPIMLPAMIEKFGWVITLLIFYLRGVIPAGEFYGSTSIHGVLGVLFVVSYYRCGLVALPSYTPDPGPGSSSARGPV